jgi:hypothetical protein
MSSVFWQGIAASLVRWGFPIEIGFAEIAGLAEGLEVLEFCFAAAACGDDVVDLEFEGWVVGGGAATGAAFVVVAAEGLVAEAVVDGARGMGLPIADFQLPIGVGSGAARPGSVGGGSFFVDVFDEFF